MPKTAVDKNDLSLGWKSEIGATGQISAVQTESVPQAMRQRTNDHLWFGVGAPDAPHVFASASA
jgi:hypothetical protein